MRDKDLRVKDFEYLVGLSRCSSVRELARKLNVEPKNLNKRLKNIEKVMDVQLFDSSTSGVSLNEAGLFAVSKLATALKCIDQAFQREQTGLINITFSGRAYLINFLLQECFDFLSLYKDSSFSFTDQSPELSERYGRLGLVDIILSHGDIVLGSDWDNQFIGEVRYSLFVNNKHPLLKQKPVSHLNQFPLLGFTYLDSQQKISRPNSLQKKNGAIRGAYVQNVQYSLSIIKNSNSIAYLPDMCAKQDIESNLIKKIDFHIENSSKPYYAHFNIDRVKKKTANEITVRLKEALNQI